MTYEAWTAKAVEERVVEAAETLMLTPNVSAGGAYWPTVVRSAEESYGYDSAWYRRRPSAGALSRMMEVWGWINGHPDGDERKLLYSWAQAKARRGASIADFAAREGVKSRTLRWAITRICERIATRLNQTFAVWQNQPVDAVAEIPAETPSQTVSSEKRATSWQATDAKPQHLPEHPDHAALIQRLERQNKRRARAKRKAERAA